MANNQHPNEPRPQQPPQQPTSTALVELPKEKALYLSEQYDITIQQVEVVRRAVCIGATDVELEFFLATCKRVGLDPFARQIWFIKRPQKQLDARGNEIWTDVGRPETSIDGYRTIAERTEQYEGQAPILWCDAKGKWSEVWLDEAPPHAAKATIFRKGFREPLVNVAHYREFCPVFRNGKSPEMWKKMGANQIAKCAEAGGFRRAFPRDLSGLITDTEIEHVDVANAGGYSIPEAPQAKQLDEKKTSVVVPANVEQREPVMSGGQERAAASGELKATDFPRDTSKQGDGTPAGSIAAAATTALGDYDGMIAALAKSEDDVDREMAKLIRKLAESTARDDAGFQEVGAEITKAKQTKKQTSDDGYSNAVMEIVEPVLQRRWRELAPQTKGARNGSR